MLLVCAPPDGTVLAEDVEYKVAYIAGSLRTAEGGILEAPDETALPGEWNEHFVSWLERRNGVIKAPKLTTELVWTGAQSP